MIRGLDRWGQMWVDILGLIGADLLPHSGRGDVDQCAPSSSGGVRFGRTALVTQLVTGRGAGGGDRHARLRLRRAHPGALQMEPQLAAYGQSELIANIVGVSITRELGPLIAAIVLTGFAGAAIAAELGTMVVGEEIEALEAHALNPIRFLVVPRVLATTIGLLLLTVIGDLTAIFAGGFMSVVFLGVPYELYKTNTLNAVVLARTF